MEGYLEYRVSGSNWKRRYIKNVNYYINFYPDDTGYKIDNDTIDLRNIINVGLGEYLKRSQQIIINTNCKGFYIELDRSILEFRTKTHADAKAWVESLVVFSGKNDNPAIPNTFINAFNACLDYLEKDANLQAGIFTGFVVEANVKNLVLDLLVDGSLAITNDCDPILVGEAFKSLLIKLPQSLLSNELVPSFQKNGHDTEQVKDLLCRVRTANVSILRRLVRLCVKMIENPARCQTSMLALSKKLSPSFVDPTDPDESANFNDLFKNLFTYDEILKKLPRRLSSYKLSELQSTPEHLKNGSLNRLNVKQVEATRTSCIIT